MNKERLLKLAELLEGLPRKHVRKFDLENWCVCGTTACAIGEATFDPWFRRRGLRLEGIHFKVPAWRGLDGWDAVQGFFDLELVSATHLFGEREYPKGKRGPKSVARRIRQFVKNQEAH